MQAMNVSGMIEQAQVMYREAMNKGGECDGAADVCVCVGIWGGRTMHTCALDVASVSMCTYSRTMVNMLTQ